MTVSMYTLVRVMLAEQLNTIFISGLRGMTTEPSGWLLNTPVKLLTSDVCEINNFGRTGNECDRTHEHTWQMHFSGSGGLRGVEEQFAGNWISIGAAGRRLIIKLSPVLMAFITVLMSGRVNNVLIASLNVDEAILRRFAGGKSPQSSS